MTNASECHMAFIILSTHLHPANGVRRAPLYFCHVSQLALLFSGWVVGGWLVGPGGSPLSFVQTYERWSEIIYGGDV